MWLTRCHQLGSGAAKRCAPPLALGLAGPLSWLPGASAACTTPLTRRYGPAPGLIGRVFVAGSPAALLLTYLAPDRLVGWPMTLSPQARCSPGAFSRRMGDRHRRCHQRRNHRSRWRAQWVATGRAGVARLSMEQVLGARLGVDAKPEFFPPRAAKPGVAHPASDPGRAPAAGAVAAVWRDRRATRRQPLAGRGLAGGAPARAGAADDALAAAVWFHTLFYGVTPELETVRAWPDAPKPNP